MGWHRESNAEQHGGTTSKERSGFGAQRDAGLNNPADAVANAVCPRADKRPIARSVPACATRALLAQHGWREAGHYFPVGLHRTAVVTIYPVAITHTHTHTHHAHACLYATFRLMHKQMWPS